MKKPLRWAGIITLLALGWLLRPFFQPLVMEFVARPLRLVVLILFIHGLRRLATLALQNKKRGPASTPGAMTPEGLRMIVWVLAMALLIVPLALESELRYTIVDSSRIKHGHGIALYRG